MRLVLVRTAVVGVNVLRGRLFANTVVLACTAFCAVGAGQILVGNNEDWHNPRTKIWFVPATPGSFGRVYVGFDDSRPQGGMNERGLWFDGFAAPPVKAAGSSDLIRRDAALVLLAQIGRVTSGAPPQVRQRIADVLTIR